MEFKEQKILATDNTGSPEREFLSWALAQDTFTEDLKKGGIVGNSKWQ